MLECDLVTDKQHIFLSVGHTLVCVKINDGTDHMVFI